MPKNELKRFASYISIGLFTTLATWLVWNLLIFLNHKAFGVDEKIWFSISQYTASILLIYPSFYLNRIFTFKDKKDQSSDYKTTTFKAYIIYITSPLIGSLIIFLINTIFPNFMDFEILILEILLPFGKLFLQGLGLAIGILINYFGQKFWIYK
jgi:putative flippase GtrA